MRDVYESGDDSIFANRDDTGLFKGLRSPRKERKTL